MNCPKCRARLIFYPLPGDVLAWRCMICGYYREDVPADIPPAKTRKPYGKRYPCTLVGCEGTHRGNERELCHTHSEMMRKYEDHMAKRPHSNALPPFVRSGAGWVVNSRKGAI
jgi:hypothetical protein